MLLSIKCRAMESNIIITSVHNSLPKNKKSEEISEYMRKLVHVTFTPDEYKDFVEELKVLVEFLNGKYPRTKAFFVFESLHTHSLGIRIEGTCEGLYASLFEIGDSWTTFKHK